jgi:hypothetical protein
MTRAPLAPVRLDADEKMPNQLADRLTANPRAAGALLELLRRLDAVELAADGSSGGSHGDPSRRQDDNERACAPRVACVVARRSIPSG